MGTRASPPYFFSHEGIVRKMDLEDPELSGANSLLFLIRICKENEPGGS